jgi:hypothetical protein
MSVIWGNSENIYSVRVLLLVTQSGRRLLVENADGAPARSLPACVLDVWNRVSRPTRDRMNNDLIFPC